MGSHLTWGTLVGRWDGTVVGLPVGKRVGVCEGLHPLHVSIPLAVCWASHLPASQHCYFEKAQYISSTADSIILPIQLDAGTVTIYRQGFTALD